MSHLSLLHQVKAYHKEAFEYISNALQIDEDSKNDGYNGEAVEWYVKGISVLEQGIQVSTMGASPEDKEKILRLQTKMKTNLEMAKDRIKVLSAGGGTTKKNNKIPPQNSTNSSTKNHSKSWTAGNVSVAKSVKPNIPPPPSSSSSSTKAKRLVTSNKTPTDRTGSGKTSSTASKPASKRFKSVPTDLAKRILDTAVDAGENDVRFQDVAGQETAKEALQEIVIMPALRPDLFSGLRTPAKGLLLFGPPGNGKTLLAKAVASEAQSVFFNISAATLTSKWVGEGEKMVKALFAVARELQPSIIFIDEIDSLLRARQEGEHDAARRLQNEFFLQFDGVGSDPSDRILVMGATNRPHELDDAALRRFPKRIYVRLPDTDTRISLFDMLLVKIDHSMSKAQIKELARSCENYSFSDLTELAKDAAMGPIREIPKNLFATIDATKMRKVNASDFQLSLRKIRPSVSLNLLKIYKEWNEKHGDVTGV